MFLKTSLISLIVFILFAVIYLISNKKQKMGLRKFSAIISSLSLICCIVFAIIFIKSNNIKIFNRVTSYNAKEEYATMLTKKGADAAYPLLPIKAFAQNNDVFFINSKNDAFKLTKEADAYTSITAFNKVSFLDSSKTLKATITEKGDLILDGYLLYSKYDGKLIEFKNETIAKNVEYCDFTSNSLIYITKNYELYALGFNEYGQLGDATTKNKSKPVFIKNNVAKAAISDTHLMIIDKYGTLYAAGDNSYSQLGNKTAISSTELTKIMQGVKDVRVGNYYSMVLSVNGEVYTAGINENGQLGNNGLDFKAELIHTLSGIEKIEINNNTCSALSHSGELYVWGDNKNKKAGCNQGDNITVPFKLSGNVYDYALSDSNVIIITKDRDVLVSANYGAFETALVFGAQIPEAFRDKNSDKYAFLDKNV